VRRWCERLVVAAHLVDLFLAADQADAQNRHQERCEDSINFHAVISFR